MPQSQVILVDVSALTDQQLAFYGWINVASDDQFISYWNPGYNETQTVSKTPPKFLVIDDVNDASYMQRDGAIIIRGPVI